MLAKKRGGVTVKTITTICILFSRMFASSAETHEEKNTRNNIVYYTLDIIQSILLSVGGTADLLHQCINLECFWIWFSVIRVWEITL